jgi:hypothetical protein
MFCKTRKSKKAAPMTLRWKFNILLIAVGLLINWPHELLGAEHSDEELRDAWSAEYLKLARATRVEATSNAGEIVLNEVPLMRWSNPVRGNGTTSGDFFVWTCNDQPVLVGTFFSYVTDGMPNARRGAMAFHALSAVDFDVECNAIKRTVHGSKLHQIDYQLEDAEVAATPVRRLQQMRTWAKACEASTELDGRIEPLRLLPNPLLVMGEDETQPSPKFGNECALFAMVTGTDAEVLILVQSVETTSESKAHWRITPARFTDLPFEVKVHGTSIWKSEGATKNGPFVSVHGLFSKPLDPR